MWRALRVRNEKCFYTEACSCFKEQLCFAYQEISEFKHIQVVLIFLCNYLKGKLTDMLGILVKLAYASFWSLYQAAPCEIPNSFFRCLSKMKSQR